MIAAYASDDDMVKHVTALEKKKSKRDMKALIRAVMETPLSDGKTYSIDDVKSISELSKLNTDLRTRIILSIANDAARGDVKATELLLKYGGYMPAIEQNVSIRLPQIINDLAPPGSELIDVTPPVLGLEDPEEEEEEEEEEKKVVSTSTVFTTIVDDDDDVDIATLFS